MHLHVHGAFFKDQTVAVVGGGDVALEDALYLSNICKNVYLIHRRDGLRGAKVLQNKVMEKENITFMPFYEVTKLLCGSIPIAIKTPESSIVFVSPVWFCFSSTASTLF